MEWEGCSGGNERLWKQKLEREGGYVKCVGEKTEHHKEYEIKGS